jgi:hypothetical protein
MQITQIFDKTNASILYKLGKPIVSLFLIFTLSGCGGGNGESESGGGDNKGGCGENFKEIRTEIDLNNIRYNLSCNYILLEDITLNTTIDAVRGWIPIGNETNRFSGIFDGNGHKISGLWIDTQTDNAGLFGYIHTAQIKNLGVEIDNQKGGIKGQNYVGGIAGYFGYSNIANSYSNGSISGNNNIGGIAGYDIYSSITNSYSNGNISGNNNIGGIAGYIYDSKIANSYSNGDINGNNAGGIAGHVYGGNITKSYSNGSIGGSNVGGIVGSVVGIAGNTHSVTIQYNVALNPSIDTKAYVHMGRIVGNIGMNSVVSDNFALETMTVKGNIVSDSNSNGAGKSKDELKEQSTYESLGWSFGNDDTSPWKMHGDYPTFYWQK